ncbi:MAG TPA: septal ring lytic transglycosylase RlpA family protein [Chitinophagales bacterium]|nr:septal ring lytic transglycosylase RlpA family protein [Chitinophagales bacterium]HNM31741.1 septal ring lytic transglycosylase RlpA family protein [Chitinophagales bacterium]
MKKRIVLLFAVFNIGAVMAAKIEYGTASHYGVGFNGRPTASGEIYSEKKLTAAHKTLPLGTVLKVTNLHNNKSVYVKVNDRGPFVKGRILDLSTKAADLLGYRNKGTTKVKYEVVSEENVPSDLMTASNNIARQNGIEEVDSIQTEANVSIPVGKKVTSTEKTATTKEEQPQPQPCTEIKDSNLNGITNKNTYAVITRIDKSKKGFYGLQIGVFSDMNSIFALINELESKYGQSLLVEQAELNGKSIFKVFIGKYQNRAYADALKSSLSDKYADAFVVKYE